MFRRSASSNDISAKFKDIAELLDGSAPTLRASKSTIGLSKFSNNKNSEHNEPVYLYPNVDNSVWMRSCEQEVIEPINGKVSGCIPEWLSGTLLRNGPGSLKVGEYKYDHLFDSSALLHRFEIKNGNVTYQSRFVETDVYKKNRVAKRIVMTQFGTRAVPDPCESIFERVSSMFNPTGSMADNSMISVYPFGDEYYTFTECPIIHRVDPRSLETIGKVNVADFVNIVSHTSHPHIMNDGTVYNLGVTIGSKGPAYCIVKFSPSTFTRNDKSKKRKISMFDQAKIISTLSSRWMLNPSYMHTFGITNNYFIIVEQPLSVGVIPLIMCKIKNKPMNSCFKWFKDENTHIHLISRKTGQTEHKFVAEAFFFLHIINAYETSRGDYVVLDICCYRDPKMLDCMYVESMKNMHQNPDYAKLFRGRPLRFVLPLKTPDSHVSSDENLILNNIDIFQNSKPKNKFTSNEEKIIPKRRKSDRLSDVLQKKASAFRMPSGQIFVKPELLCNLGCETPRINYEFNLGKPYQYFYAMSSDVDIKNPGTLIKVDVINKTKKIWCEKDVYPSEPIFVPNPKAKFEDDGIVLSALVWGQERETEVGLLVLNATTFKEIARATFDTPSPVPKCLHGWFTKIVS